MALTDLEGASRYKTGGPCHTIWGLHSTTQSPPAAYGVFLWAACTQPHGRGSLLRSEPLKAWSAEAESWLQVCGVGLQVSS